MATLGRKLRRADNDSRQLNTDIELEDGGRIVLAKTIKES
jgi:hypothetical protein